MLRFRDDGFGKRPDDQRMRWLRAGEVPTLGNWFRAAGYDMDNARIQGGGNYVETLGGFTGNGVRAEITMPAASNLGA